MLEKEEQQWLNDVIGKITRKMDWVSEKSKDKIPYTTTENGSHDNRGRTAASGSDSIYWWTNGFWGGMLWLMHHETGNPKYKEIAGFSEEWLDECFQGYYGLHHDVGFMWLTTSVANYRVTKNPDSRRRALHAANLLAGRFNLAGGFIRAWNNYKNDTDTRGWAIIDCMMNLPLLYWATEETGDPRFKQIAMKHADTAMTAFIRPDGSANHIVEFDPFNGNVVKTYAGQGYGEGSSWTRGQSWALYGFMMSYIHTAQEDYLQTAKRVAHYFIANIPEDGVIPVDFRQPKEPKLEDDTAAAIAACGLIELAKMVGPHERELYLRAAIKMLKQLDKRSDWTTASDAIIQRGSSAYHAPTHHEPIIYGDYYFMEAVFKLKGNDLYLW